MYILGSYCQVKLQSGTQLTHLVTQVLSWLKTIMINLCRIETFLQVVYIPWLYFWLRTHDLAQNWDASHIRIHLFSTQMSPDDNLITYKQLSSRGAMVLILEDLDCGRQIVCKVELRDVRSGTLSSILGKYNSITKVNILSCVPSQLPDEKWLKSCNMGIFAKFVVR